MSRRLNKFCLNVTAVCWSVNGEFVTSPSNVAVSTNDRVKFTCTTDDTSASIIWYYSDTGSTDITAIPLIVDDCNVEPSYRSTYNTERTTGGCNLIINSTRLTDAGTYMCNDHPLHAAAELVVLGNYFIYHFLILMSDYIPVMRLDLA